MNINNIKTLGELKKSGYKAESVKDEIRRNLIEKMRNRENSFLGIIGYEESVIPDTERALLSRHNILSWFAWPGQDQDGKANDRTIG